MPDIAKVASIIETHVHERVAAFDCETGYREPLVGFAPADDPLWQTLKEKTGGTHLLPSELMGGARTVVAFFLPFSEEMVKRSRAEDKIPTSWATAYVETNALINSIIKELIEKLSHLGVKGAAQPATHNFNKTKLVAGWSHRSAAALAGLGSLGLNRMLITKQGCAGRCGSFVVDVEIPATEKDPGGCCLYFEKGSCGVCVKKCATSALQFSGEGEFASLDRQRCYKVLLENEAATGADACGKCVIFGPCALRNPVSK